MQRIWSKPNQSNPSREVAPVQSPYKLQPQSVRELHIPHIDAATMEEEELMEPERDHDNFDEVADIARRSYKLVKEVMGELNVEYKMLQQLATSFQPTWGSAGGNSMVLVNQSSQGNTDGTRNGDRIKISNFYIAGRIASNATAAQQPYTVRCIVYWQKGPDTVTVQFPTALGNQTGLLDFDFDQTSLATSAPKDYDLDDTTEILWDKVWHVSVLPSDGAIHTFKKLIKIQRHTQYENNSNVINNGVLRVCWVSDASSATADRPLVTYLSRVYFVDN